MLDQFIGAVIQAQTAQTFHLTTLPTHWLRKQLEALSYRSESWSCFAYDACGNDEVRDEHLLADLWDRRRWLFYSSLRINSSAVMNFTSVLLSYANKVFTNTSLVSPILTNRKSDPSHPGKPFRDIGSFTAWTWRICDMFSTLSHHTRLQCPQLSKCRITIYRYR